MKPVGVKLERMDNGVLVFGIEGHFDASMASAVNERVHDVLEEPCEMVVFDLGNLDYISSAGLRVLLSAAKKMKSKGGKAALCSVNSGIQRVLDVSGFAKVIPIYDDLASVNSDVVTKSV